MAPEGEGHDTVGSKDYDVTRDGFGWFWVR